MFRLAPVTTATRPSSRNEFNTDIAGPPWCWVRTPLGPVGQPSAPPSCSQDRAAELVLDDLVPRPTHLEEHLVRVLAHVGTWSESPRRAVDRDRSSNKRDGVPATGLDLDDEAVRMHLRIGHHLE